MPKPDPALLDLTRYPFQCEIPTRFSDLDMNKHLNNVALVSLIEDARVRFHAACGFQLAVKGLGGMVASLAVEYLGQGYYPAPVTIGVAALKVGTSSYTMAQLVTQESRIVATATAVMVCVGPNGPAPLPDSYRDGIGPWLFRT